MHQPPRVQRTCCTKSRSAPPHAPRAPSPIHNFVAPSTCELRELSMVPLRPSQAALRAPDRSPSPSPTWVRKSLMAALLSHLQCGSGGAVRRQRAAVYWSLTYTSEPARGGASPPVPEMVSIHGSAPPVVSIHVRQPHASAPTRQPSHVSPHWSVPSRQPPRVSTHASAASCPAPVCHTFFAPRSPALCCLRRLTPRPPLPTAL